MKNCENLSKNFRFGNLNCAKNTWVDDWLVCAINGCNQRSFAADQVGGGLLDFILTHAVRQHDEHLRGSWTRIPQRVLLHVPFSAC